MKNIIHQYFKKKIEGHIIFIQVNPVTFQGLEMIISPDMKTRKTERIFNEEIYGDLKADDFETCSPLEFNLFLKGIYT